MAFLFNRTKQRQPADIARLLKDLLVRLWESPITPKLEEDLSKQLCHMKVLVQGVQDVRPEDTEQLVTAILQEDLLFELAQSIRHLPFEARKDTQTIFSHIIRFRHPDSHPEQLSPVVAHIVEQRPEILVKLCHGYENTQSAMPCGSILRELLKVEAVAMLILYNDSTGDKPVPRLRDIRLGTKQSGNGLFWKFFHWINQGTFEVSADAFTTFRDILTRHKKIIPEYLAVNFDIFFPRFHKYLILSDSYVTKRQSIKLLGDILLDRSNYSVMTAYVASGEHLKLCMNLLKDDRRMVQYEGFHIFKVFVANPNKSVPVQRILINNRDRLLRFLPNFLADRKDDDQFTDEKSFLLRQIEMLPLQPIEPRPEYR
ncbi:hypothetical protein VTO42DRAFT_5873 [Malbranchea cinnamomea]